MIIKILWTGCVKCKILFNTVQNAVKTLEIDASIEKIEDIKEILKYEIMTTPGLVINEKLVMAWKIPSEEIIIELLKNNSENNISTKENTYWCNDCWCWGNC